jgi:hypothetical protein
LAGQVWAMAGRAADSRAARARLLRFIRWILSWAARGRMIGRRLHSKRKWIYLIDI